MQTLPRNSQRERDGAAIAKKSAGSLWRTAFLAALVGFAGFNILLASQAGRQLHDPSEVLTQSRQEVRDHVPPRHSWAWWLTKLYEEQTTAPDVVVFGSSLLGSAHASIDASKLNVLLDVLTHRRMAYFEDRLAEHLGRKVSAFSLGSPGEMISDCYMISKTLFASKKPRLVVATIAPRDFVDNTLPYPAATDHYKFFSNMVDCSNMNSAAYPDSIARLGAEIDRLPLKKLGKQSLSKYLESAKNDFDQSGRFAIKPGDSLVPAGAVPKPVDNSKEYIERFKNPMSANYGSEMLFFKKWLSDLKAQGIPVVVVCMPTTASNRRLLPSSFWQRFRFDVSSACKANSADWLDLSDCGLFQQSDYLDTVHLNAYGAVRLFPVIAQRVSMFPAAVKALHQSDR